MPIFGRRHRGPAGRTRRRARLGTRGDLSPREAATAFFDRPLETLDRDSLRLHQERRLRELLPHVARSPFYAEKLKAAGCDPARLQTLEDLARAPLTTKAELVESQRRHPPYGLLPSMPVERFCHFHQTSGTSGQPLRWLDTAADWQTWERCWGCVYRGAGVGEADLVFGAFSFGPYISHWTAMAGAARVGALRIAGGGMSSRQRLETILASGATVLVSTPTYALHLAEVAAELGLDLRSGGVRVAIHAGEPGASVPAVKRRIEEAWGARVYDHAGATEVGAWGFDCEREDDGIHLNELEFVFDVVEPGTGAPVPDGTRGELVATCLSRYGMPVLRYRTGDLVVRSREPCGCGRSLARIRGGVLGRADDMLIVRGVNLYPAAMDDVIRSVPGVLEYEVEIRTVGGMDDLLIKAEAAPGHDYATVGRALVEGFRSRFNIRVEAAEAPPGSLPRYELKARRYKRV